MEVSAFNVTGDVLAVAGRRGYVHLVDWRSGAAQVVGSVKMNAPVKAVWWSRGIDRQELVTLGEDAEVYVWDVAERKCLRRWTDDGGFGSVTMTGDNAGRYFSIGHVLSDCILFSIILTFSLPTFPRSNTGIVNVYGGDALSPEPHGIPKALKTLGNLTTSISTLRFNHDSQLLAVASNRKKDQMRLVSRIKYSFNVFLMTFRVLQIHVPSLTAYSNWPTSSTPLGHVTAIDFSSGSEYVAIGNNRGRVLLYHLSHFVS